MRRTAFAKPVMTIQAFADIMQDSMPNLDLGTEDILSAADVGANFTNVTPAMAARAEKYLELIADLVLADLRQNPLKVKRASGSNKCMSLTKACGAFCCFPQRRFASGIEFLISHGIPMSGWASRRCSVTQSQQEKIRVLAMHLSQLAASRFVGNGMHSAIVGLTLMYCIFHELMPSDN